jgi:hypothetical protein
MNDNRARWLFLIACLLALAAVVQDFRFDAASRRSDQATTKILQEAATLRTRMAELRGGQTAYLATGQGPDFWMRRVTDVATELETGLGRLRAEATTPEAQGHFATAGSALTELLAVDKRARQALGGDQRFLASDILFAEGLGPAQTFVDAVAAGAAAELAAFGTAEARQARLRLAMMPTALLLVIAAGVVWAQSKRKNTPASAAASMAQMLRDLPPPVKAPTAATVTASSPAPRSAQPVSASDLAQAAELCVDLGRVLSADDVPVLLGRAAGVLNASGLVVWVVTGTGDALVPALSHGYSEKVIAKLGALDPAADNITSVCFRTMRPQSMPGIGQPGATSAIAVPLVTADGCHGVLSAELPVAKPASESVALARIIAAQLAAMTSPAEAAGGANVAVS